jgi:predicted RNase H-like HicB family nuclease
MRPFQYPATLTPEKAGAFTVRFADLGEAITSGVTRSDALVQAADCLDEAIAGRIADGLEIPMPSAARWNQPLITLPAPTAAKAALYMAMKESRIKNTELADARLRREGSAKDAGSPASDQTSEDPAGSRRSREAAGGLDGRKGCLERSEGLPARTGMREDSPEKQRPTQTGRHGFPRHRSPYVV